MAPWPIPLDFAEELTATAAVGVAVAVCKSAITVDVLVPMIWGPAVDVTIEAPVWPAPVTKFVFSATVKGVVGTVSAACVCRGASSMTASRFTAAGGTWTSKKSLYDSQIARGKDASTSVAKHRKKFLKVLSLGGRLAFALRCNTNVALPVELAE